MSELATDFLSRLRELLRRLPVAATSAEPPRPVMISREKIQPERLARLAFVYVFGLDGLGTALYQGPWRPQEPYPSPKPPPAAK